MEPQVIVKVFNNAVKMSDDRIWNVSESICVAETSWGGRVSQESAVASQDRMVPDTQRCGDTAQHKEKKILRPEYLPRYAV
ncbi:hypothetical protein NDU88_001622 [Pleurodeles waltl]|uniref:Uncharacterized protein n=1 Tax=Pleurodeles waltl TaxID=8319 RepID=A0AAV7RBT3_PLEWA|nr:hypothetical protein NDU88_001622 [Pleurodeles waltl]